MRNGASGAATAGRPWVSFSPALPQLDAGQPCKSSGLVEMSLLMTAFHHKPSLLCVEVSVVPC